MIDVGAAGMKFDEPLTRAEFDPADHPRGWHGRWAKTATGPGGVTAAAQAHVGKLTGNLNVRELHDYNVSEYKKTRLDPAFHYTPEQEKAINFYTDREYEDINNAARAGKTTGNLVSAIDSAMQPLPDDLVLVREVKGQDAFEGVQVGDVLADDGFSSTTLTSSGRFASARSGTTVMHILTPKGSPAVWANPVSHFAENEVILPRGQHMVVMRVQPRPNRSDVMDVYMLAVPQEAAA